MKTFKELITEKKITENLDEIQEMAYTDVQIACDNAKRIMEMMDEGIQPESWNYSKITLAADYLTTVYTAMRAKKSEESDYDSYYEEETNLSENKLDDFRSKLIHRAVSEYAGTNNPGKNIRGVDVNKIASAFASKKNFGTKAQDELESELGLPIGVIKSLAKEIQAELKANFSGGSTSGQTQAQRIDRYLKQKWVK